MTKTPKTTSPSANIPSDSWPGKQLDAHTHRWLEFAVWALVYGGIVLASIGFATGDKSGPMGWTLGVAGASVTALGVVLIYIRSRFPRN